jgi:NAD(P)H-flavin reductase/hemoglobin-like flavoprotein
MAIALDGGYPDEEPLGSFAGQHDLVPSRRGQEPPVERHFSLTDPHLRAPARIARNTGAWQSGEPAAQPVSGDASADTSAYGRATRLPNIRSVDARLIKGSFVHVAANAEAAMEHFYSRLFVRYPEIRSMFPHAMREHMDRVFASLTRIVWSIDSPDSLLSYLGELGRGHRKFGVKDRHYELFLTVLLETVRHFNGHYWTDETQVAWEAACSHVSTAMRAAAEQDAAHHPPWWLGEVVQHDQRSQDLAILTIRPDQPLRYTPGQYLAVQVPRWPRVWRNFSIANAPRDNGLIDLHVRAVPGGLVSGSLVHNTGPGDTLLLGQARGAMTASADPGRDLLCVAGGTGLAPLKAIIEAVIGTGRPGKRRKITLFFGARTEEGLYDLADLRVLEWIYPALTVIPVVSDQPGYDGIKGMLPEIAARHENVNDADILISGPDRMVARTVALLASRVKPGQIRHDPPDAAR